MKRFVQVVLYLEMAILTFAAVIGFLAHQFPIAAQEQRLARQVGFEVLGIVVSLWIVSRFWQREVRWLLIPIVFNIGGVLSHGFDAVIVNANLGLPAPTADDIYAPLVINAVFLVFFAVGYVRVRGRSRSTASPAIPNST